MSGQTDGKTQATDGISSQVTNAFNELMRVQQELQARVQAFAEREAELAAREGTIERQIFEAKAHAKEADELLRGLEQRESDAHALEGELTMRTASLDAREQQLNARSRQLDGREEQVEDNQVQLDAMRKQLDERVQQLDARSKAIDARQQQLDERSKEIEARLQRLDARYKEIDTRQKQLDERSKEIEARQQQLDERERELTASQATLAEIEERERELRAAEQRVANLADREARLSEQEERCSRLREESEATRVLVEQLEAEISARDAAVREREQALEKFCTMLTSTATALVDPKPDNVRAAAEAANESSAAHRAASVAVDRLKASMVQPAGLTSTPPVQAATPTAQSAAPAAPSPTSQSGTPASQSATAAYDDDAPIDLSDFSPEELQRLKLLRQLGTARAADIAAMIRAERDPDSPRKKRRLGLF